MLKCFKSRNIFQDFSNFLVLYFLEKLFKFVAHFLMPMDSISQPAHLK